MAKRFKLKLSLPSFQLCRPKKPASSFLQPDFIPPPPPTATYLFSPINPKAFEIAYPANFPDPPPTTPTTYNPPRSPFSKRLHYLSSSKVTPLIKTPCNSPSSCDHSSYNNYPSIKGDRNCDDLSLNSTNCDFSCSEDETDSLFSSSGDFSSFSIYGGSFKKTSKNAKAERKLKRYASNKFGTSANDGGELVVENNINNKGSNKSVFRRWMPPCAAKGKVKESFAVVTRSDDPYEDFKRSMLEMILEKQMFEAKDLEELLQCFLSLNSRHHHPVIVAAFTEIWEILFL